MNHEEDDALRDAIQMAGESCEARLPSLHDLIASGRRARRRRRAAQVGGTFATAALMAAGGFALRAEVGAGALPASSHATSTTYPRLSWSEAISSTLAGFPRHDFASLKVVVASDKKSVAPLWMHATVNADSKATGAGVQALWEACLADGAIAEHLAGDASNLEQVLVGVHIKARYPDGSVREQGGCGGTLKPGRVFVAQAQNWSDDEIVSSVDAVLARYGLTPVDVRVLHPLGPAVSVVASVQDVDSIKGQFSAIDDAILGDPYRYEGIYLEIRGPLGKPLAGGWYAVRAGSGGVWFAPGMDGELGINHGGLATSPNSHAPPSSSGG